MPLAAPAAWRSRRRSVAIDGPRPACLGPRVRLGTRAAGKRYRRAAQATAMQVHPKGPSLHEVQKLNGATVIEDLREFQCRIVLFDS